MKMDTRMSNIKPIMEVPNADFKIFLYVRVHKKMIARKFRILNPKNSSRANNSRILRIKNAKFSGHYFRTNANIQANFQICISVPLRLISKSKFRISCRGPSISNNLRNSEKETESLPLFKS